VTTIASNVTEVAPVEVKLMDNKANRKQDWEEFYDESMKAKYWYNNSSGEASWIKPY